MNCLPVLESTRQEVDKTRQKIPKLVLSGPSLSTVDAGTVSVCLGCMGNAK